MTDVGSGVRHRLTTDFDAARDSPGLLLWQLTNTWQAAQRAALRPFDLTHVQSVLLASLTWLESDTPAMQRELAAHAHTDPMMTSQVQRASEAKGLVQRRMNPAANASVEAVERPSSAASATGNAFSRPC